MEHPTVEPKVFGSLLLDIAISLLRSGASGRRIRKTVAAFSAAYQFSLHTDISPKSISITLLNKNYFSVFNGTRSTQSYGVDFKILSAVNRLTTSVTKKQWPLEEVKAEVERMLHLPNYPRLLILIAVSIAGAGFCYTFGGNPEEMCVTFVATFFGLLVKQELLKKSTNAYLCTLLSALTAALITGLFYVTVKDIRLEHAFATCSLFLIPGVPLLNSIIDLVDGNILYGVERGVNAMMHAFAIAVGLTAALLVFNIAG